MTLRWMVVFGALLAGTAGASAGDKTDVVRDLAGRVGPIVGSALACRDIARPRIQMIVDKFAAVITEASSSEAERSDLTQLLDRSVADGRNAVTSGKTANSPIWNARSPDQGQACPPSSHRLPPPPLRRRPRRSPPHPSPPAQRSAA